MPRLIGLTGGIATGKSTVAALLAARGAAVIDADRLAREVVEPGSPGLAEIVEAFGAGVLDGAGGLDRGAVGGLVFADETARRRLEAITHPRIRQLMGERAATALSGPAPLVVLDIPLLFEAGRTDGLGGVMVVWCPADLQVARLRTRDGLDAAEAARRVGAQLPIDEKRRRATWVIDNSGAPEAAAAQVGRWWSAEVGRRAGSAEGR